MSERAEQFTPDRVADMALRAAERAEIWALAKEAIGALSSANALLFEERVAFRTRAEAAESRLAEIEAACRRICPDADGWEGEPRYLLIGDGSPLIETDTVVGVLDGLSECWAKMQEQAEAERALREDAVCQRNALQMELASLRPEITVPDKGEVNSPARDLRVIASRIASSVMHGNHGHLTHWCVRRLVDIADTLTADKEDADRWRSVKLLCEIRMITRPFDGSVMLTTSLQSHGLPGHHKTPDDFADAAKGITDDPPDRAGVAGP